MGGGNVRIAALLPSNPTVNDAADDDGMLRVEPGDRLPGIPRHSLKGGVRYDVTEAWNLAVETVVASSRIFFGDEGNDTSSETKATTRQSWMATAS